MKNITKVLSFVLLLAVVFTAVFLTGCEEKATTNDVQTMKIEVTSDVDKVQKDLDAAKATITQLQQALATLTDASATKAALQGALDDITANKTAAETELAKVNAALAALGDTYATDEELANALAALGDTYATDEELTNAIKTVNDALATLGDTYATDEELTNAIETVNGALQAQKTDLQGKIDASNEEINTIKGQIATISTNMTTVTAAIANLNSTYATDAELAAAVQALQDQIGGLTGEGSFQSQYDKATEALFVKGALKAEAGDVTDDFTFENFVATIATVKATDYVNPDDYDSFMVFADVLKSKLSRASSIEMIKDVWGQLVARIDLDADVNETLQAAMDLFNDTVADVDPLLYADQAYIDFVAAADELFDGFTCDIVAVTADGKVAEEQPELDAIQNALEALIGDMPTLEESLIAEMDAIENGTKVTLADGQLDKLNAIWAKIVANDVVGELADGVEDRYNAFVNARARLEDAEAATAATAALFAALPDDPAALLYNTKTTTIAEIGAIYAQIKADYFTDTTVTALYGIDMKGLTDYNEYLAYKAADDALILAKAQLDAIELTVLEGFKDVNPIYSDLNDIEAEIALITTWAENNNLEIGSENYVLIVNASKEATTGGVTRINAVKDYAAAMAAIYEEQEVAALAEAVAAEIETGANGVLYTHLGTLKDISAAMKALQDAIVAVDGYDALTDGNFDAMLNLDADAYAELAAIETRYHNISDAKDAVDTLDELVVALHNKPVGFQDRALIDKYNADLEGIFVGTLAKDDAELGEINTTNYNEMTTKILVDLATLEDDYDKLTAQVQALYDSVKDIVYDATNNSLVDLYKIIWVKDRMIEEENKLTINASEIPLKDPDHAGVTYQTFINALDQKMNLLIDLAADAEADAVAVNAKIAGIAAETFDLNKSAAFNTAIQAFYNWAITYIGEDVAELEAGTSYLDYIKAIADCFADAAGTVDDGFGLGINGIKNYTDASKTYAFISAADYETIVAAAETYETTRAAAAEEWAGIEEDFAPLLVAADITIHSDAFEEAKTRYLAYVDTYYAGLITNAQYGETDAYADFMVNYGTYKTLCQDAEDLYDEIMADAIALKALSAGTPAIGDVAAIRANAAALTGKIADYRADYCDDADSDQCKFLDENGNNAELIAYQAEAKALMVYAQDAGQCVPELSAAVLASQTKKVDLCDTVEKVIAAYDYFKSQYANEPLTNLFA